MNLTLRLIRNWADERAILDLTLAELDYRLTYALAAIYRDPFLAGRLCLKGGTVLNKLYFPTLSRLSVDLDFNAVGPKAQVLAERSQIISRLETLFAAQNADYTVTHDYRYEQTNIVAHYTPLSGGPRQRLKLEISTVERVPILGRTARNLILPDGSSAPIATYYLEELTATKLRALYARRKGRDIYDLWRITGLDLNGRAVRKLTLYYFYHAKMVFHYPTFLANVEEKLRHHGFADDVRGLIRVGQDFDWAEACRAVLERFAFLGELEERDTRFLDFARMLLGKPVSGAALATVADIEYPIAWLMEEIPISEEAAVLRQEDIRVFLA